MKKRLTSLLLAAILTLQLAGLSLALAAGGIPPAELTSLTLGAGQVEAWEGFSPAQYDYALTRTEAGRAEVSLTADWPESWQCYAVYQDAAVRQRTVPLAAGQSSQLTDLPSNTCAVTVVLSHEQYPEVQTTYTLTLAPPAQEGGGGSVSATVTVLGDRHHGEEACHTYRESAHALEVWIPRSSYTLDAGSTAWDFLRRALERQGLSYELQWGYLTDVNGLGQMDNGANSGWLLLVNGQYPTVGMTDYTVRSGDHLVLHYTDDFAVEFADWSEPDGGSGGETQPPPQEKQPSADGLPFTDVGDEDWFYPAVSYVWQRGLMSGVGDEEFAPLRTANRVMLVQSLYNLDGQPAVQSSPGFSDLERNAWYLDAVTWAEAAGLTRGYGDGRFGVADDVTREQIAVFLMVYARHRGWDVTARGDLSAFADEGQVSPWAWEAMEWAVGAGILTGRDGLLACGDFATRGELAALLMTFSGVYAIPGIA